MIDEETIIQADEGTETPDPADVATPEVATEIEGTPSDGAQPERAASELDAGETEVAEELEPFRHTVNIKRAGKEVPINFEYDTEGNFTDDTLKHIRGTYAKTGLEQVAQDKDRLYKDANARANAAEAQVKFYKDQTQHLHEQYQKPVEFIRSNPAIQQALNKRGIELPDPERMALDAEKQEVQNTRREIEVHNFVTRVGETIKGANPDFTPEQYNAIGTELMGSPLLRMLNNDPKSKLLEAVPDVAREAQMVIAQMVMDGKLPNTALEQARSDGAAARKATADTQARAAKRASVINPLAGGRPKGGKGREVKVDLRGMSPSEYIAYTTTGKLPT